MIRQLLVLIVAQVAVSSMVSAQVPTAEQIELLRSMNPEDRSALLEELGVDEDLVEGLLSPNNSSQGRDPRANDAGAQDNKRMLIEREAREKNALQPEDSLLID